MILDASEQHEHRIWDFKHKRGHTNSSANPNYIPTHLIPGSAKKKSVKHKSVFWFPCPLSPKAQCWLHLGCSALCEKKVRSCCSYGPCVCSNIGHRGKGGQTFVIVSCPADFFFADPGPGVKGLGIILPWLFSLFCCFLSGAGYNNYDFRIMTWGVCRAWLP